MTSVSVKKDLAMENLPGTKWAADGRLVCSVAQKRIQPGRGVLAVLNTCLIDPSWQATQEDL